MFMLSFVQSFFPVISCSLDKPVVFSHVHMEPVIICFLCVVTVVINLFQRMPKGRSWTYSTVFTAGWWFCMSGTVAGDSHLKITGSASVSLLHITEPNYSGYTLELGSESIQIKLLRLLFSCRGKLITSQQNRSHLFMFFSLRLIQRPEAQPVVPGAGERQKKSTAATSVHSSCHPTQKCENQTQNRKIINAHEVPQFMNASVDWIIKRFKKMENSI